MRSYANSTYENQFGFIQRPTHRNTTWHRAQFEVCGHRFADVSEFGYGVALLNDSKYGHACENSTLRLSLLRASTLPDDEQDQGAHHFTFAILPHRGSFAESDVPAVARMFNYPLHLRRRPSIALTESELMKSRGDDRHGQGPFSVVGARNVVLDTVKRGEEDDFSARSKHETVILRLYEAYGGAAKAKIAATIPEGRKIASAELVDVRPCAPWLRCLKDRVCLTRSRLQILERKVDNLTVSDKSVSGSASSTFNIDLPRMRAFQIVTVKLMLA